MISLIINRGSGYWYELKLQLKQFGLNKVSMKKLILIIIKQNSILHFKVHKDNESRLLVIKT